MNGWVTMTSAVLTVIYAVAGYLLGYHDLTTMMVFISGSGFGAGLGRKVDKNTAAVQAATIIDVSLSKEVVLPAKLVAAVGGKVASALQKVLK